MMSSNWSDELKSYLFNYLLKRFIPNDNIRSILINDEAMKIWEIVFTHSSFDRNVGKNYESYETLGDRFLDANFVLYLLEKHAYNISSSEITNFKSFYMSKVFQADISKQLRMDKYVRIGNINVSTHIAEDIFEAFTGGLMKVGMLLKSKTKPNKMDVGAGNILIFNFIVSLFKDIQLDYNVTKGHPKTQVKNIFDKLRWGEAIEQVTKSEDNLQIVSILLTQDAINDLARFGVIIKNPIIGQESSWTKAGAIPNAYLKALNYLNSIGVSELWIAQRKISEDQNNPILRDLLKEAHKKMKQQNFESIVFVSSQTNREGKLMQLIGITPNQQQVILMETPEHVKNQIEGKQQLLNLYLQN